MLADVAKLPVIPPPQMLLDPQAFPPLPKVVFRAPFVLFLFSADVFAPAVNDRAWTENQLRSGNCTPVANGHLRCS